MRRALCRAAAAGCLMLTAGPIAALVSGGRAAAVAPSAVGYWVKLGVPAPTVPPGGLFVADDPTTAVPAQPPPVLPLPVPSPPVSGSEATGPTAISAVRVAGISPGQDATLSLQVANGSAVPPPSVTTIVACPIVSAWQPPPGGGGDISKAPAYDCSSSSSGKVAADNSSISWLLPGSYQTTAGELDVALVPSPAGSPAPFSVAFNAPGPSAVQAPMGAAMAPPDVTSSPPDTVPLPDASAAPAAGPVVVPDSGPAPVIPVSPPATLQLRTSPSSSGLGRLAGVRLPKFGDDRAHRIMAVVVLLAMAAGWWWIGGQPVRRPRLLGALASGETAPGASPGAGGPTAGVGRFSRPRVSGPRRL